MWPAQMELLELHVALELFMPRAVLNLHEKVLKGWNIKLLTFWLLNAIYYHKLFSDNINDDSSVLNKIVDF